MGSTWRTYRWLLRVYGRAVWLVVALCVIQAAMAGIAVGYALMMRDAIDAAVAHDESAFIREAIVFAAAIIVQIALRAAAVTVAERARASMDNRMRSHTFAGILEAPLERTQTHHSGELMNRLTSDVSVVSGAVTSLAPNAASMAIRIVGVVAVMIVLAPALTAVFLAGGIMMAGASFLLRGLLKRLHKQVQEAEGRVRAYMQEALESLLVIRAFGVGGKVRALADARMDAHRRARMRRVTVTAVASTGLASAMNLGYLIGFVWCGFGILHGTLSYGTMMAVIQLIGQIQSPFAMMGGMFPQHAAMLASAERLMEVGEPRGHDDVRGDVARDSTRGDVAHGGVEEPCGDVARRTAACDDAARHVSARELYRDAEGIRFAHVDFTYGRNIVLDDFSCDIRKGDFVAITGRSGIGKSTLMKLLLGAYTPQHGEIGVAVRDGGASDGVAVGDCWDGDARVGDDKPGDDRPDTAVPDSARLGGVADGAASEPTVSAAIGIDRLVPPRDIPRGFFAYVPQGNALMSGTIREAVAFADPDPDPAHIDDARVREACRVADADGFVTALPDGYDTRLGEHGAGLSEGQMQRIAVARALYSGAPVLLLDESTSALDTSTEHAMLERIRALRDRTVLIVTHRAEVLEYCDTVIRLGAHWSEGRHGDCRQDPHGGSES